jgi:hypothetical protein
LQVGLAISIGGERLAPVDAALRHVARDAGDDTSFTPRHIPGSASAEARVSGKIAQFRLTPFPPSGTVTLDWPGSVRVARACPFGPFAPVTASVTVAFACAVPKFVSASAGAKVSLPKGPACPTGTPAKTVLPEPTDPASVKFREA